MSDPNLPEWDEDFHDPTILPSSTDSGPRIDPDYISEEDRVRTKFKPAEELGGTLLPADDPLFRRKFYKKAIYYTLSGSVIVGLCLVAYRSTLPGSVVSTKSPPKPAPIIDGKVVNDTVSFGRPINRIAALTLEGAIKLMDEGDFVWALRTFEEMEKTGVIPAGREQLFYQRYGDTLLALGRGEDALHAFLTAIRHDDRTASPELLNNAAYQIFHTHGDLGMAEELAQRAHKLAPNDGRIEDTIGCILFERKQYAQATETFQRARKNSEGVYQSAITEHLGDSLYLEGKNAEAIDAWKHAAGDRPLSADLWDKINSAMAKEATTEKLRAN